MLLHKNFLLNQLMWAGRIEIFNLNLFSFDGCLGLKVWSDRHVSGIPI